MGSVDKLPLPRTADDVTVEWLSSVLGHTIKIAEVTRSVLDETATKLFITCHYEDGVENENRPRYLCVKGGLNPAMYNLEGYREILKLIYTREALFFSRLASKLRPELVLPKVWWAGEDMEMGQGINVMEDLNHAGAMFGSPLDDWSVASVKTGVEQLAALHSSTWGASATGGNAWIVSGYDNIILGMTMNWDNMVLAEGRPELPPIIKDSRERVVAALVKHLAIRNPRFQAILAHYLDALHRFGAPSLTVDDEEVMVEYHKSCMSGIGWMLTPYNMQRKEKVVAMSARYGAALEDHRVVQLIESLPGPTPSS